MENQTIVRKEARVTFRQMAAPRTFAVTLYDASELDRDNETIDLAGVKAREPVSCQVDHDNSVLRTVGTVRNVHASGKALRGTVTFAPEGVSEVADQVHRQVQSGLTSSVSIGFLGVPTKAPEGHRVWKHVEVVEVSFVSVPASPGARVDGKALTTWLHGADADDEVAVELDDQTIKSVPTDEEIDVDAETFRAAWRAGIAAAVREALDAAVQQGVRQATRQSVRHTEPFEPEPVLDVRLTDVQRAVAEVVPALVREQLGPAVRAAFDRARGRVD